MNKQTKDYITFAVAQKKPESFTPGKYAVRRFRPPKSKLKSSTSSEGGIPENHYLKELKEYSQERCGELLQESAWDPKLTQPSNNGFVLTVSEAYNRHHNLVIRPDDVFLAIITQFSAYVNGNAEDLRKKFVAHEGKKELVTYQMATLRTADYAKMTSDMVDVMKKNIVDVNLADWILPRFSTTEYCDTIAASVVFMASMKKYFDYNFCLLCGIPNVTLMGTIGDWETIHEKASFLRQYGSICNKWADMLEKVTMEFVKARKGSPDVNFWERICSNLGGGSGPRYLSGWITVFCVFNEDGKWQGDQLSINDWGRTVTSEYPIVNTNDIPAGYVTVPVKIDDNGIEYDSMMFAGHMNTKQVNKTTVTPCISWAIVLKEEEAKEDVVDAMDDDDEL